MIDIKHNSGGDIDIRDGNIRYDECTEQHKKDILLSGKGHYKESPALGVGLVQYLNDENPENMLRAIHKECTADGMKVHKVAIQQGYIQIDAEYENSSR